MSDDPENNKWAREGTIAFIIHLFSVIALVGAYELTGARELLGKDTHPVAGMSLACFLVLFVWSNALAIRSVRKNEFQFPAVLVFLSSGFELFLIITTV
jgi:hypothetical protein